MSTHGLHPMSSTLLNPTCPQHLLNEQFVGKPIQQLPGPAIIVDLAKVKKQCSHMLDAAKSLGVGFRAHVKTHKTAELSRLQVGNDPSTPALFVVSTVAEAEGLLPVLEEYQAQGRRVNVLYGIAPSTSCFARLAAIRSIIGPDSISFMIDHPAQLDQIAAHFSGTTSTPIPIYIKTDTGYGRAGLTPSSQSLLALLQHAYTLRSTIHVIGFYCHLGTSYSSSNPASALDYLYTELDGSNAAARVAYEAGFPASTRFTLSVGATPTAVAAQNLLSSASPADASLAHAASRTKSLIAQLQSHGHTIELHAGVYPVLDMQQLATHARPVASPASAATPTITAADIAITVLAEVLSVYTERGRPEALIGAGVVALGREPCKSYPGWAVVAPAPWENEQTCSQIYEPDGDKTGWIVGRVAQEHGILTWEGDSTRCRQLKVGEKLLLWPNHACIACSNFGWVLVIDSIRGVDLGSEVVEVWTRWRGW